jgi:hypothetical protein
MEHAVKRGILVSTQHLLYVRGQPLKTLMIWLVAGPPRCKMTSCQQSGTKYANPNLSPYLAVALFERSFKLFYRAVFLCAYFG